VENGLVMIDPVTVTIVPYGSYVSIDLDSYVSDLGDDVSGVILEIVQGSNEGSVYWRKYGSTDDYYNTLLASHRAVAFCGVNSSHIFQVKVSSSTTVVYLIGYTKGGFVFFDNAIDKKVSSSSTWEDVDASGSAPAGATGLIFELRGNGSNTYSVGLRKKGSTDYRTNSAYSIQFGTWIIGCNENRVCQQYASTTTFQSLLLRGYVTQNSGLNFYTNAIDYSLSSTGSYQSLSALPSGSIAGLFEIASSNAYKYAMRKKGSTRDVYAYTSGHNMHIVECDSNRLVEGKIENLAVDFWLVAYVTSPSITPQTFRKGSRCIT